MELKELTDRTLELFGVTAPDQLGPALLSFYQGRKMEHDKTPFIRAAARMGGGGVFQKECRPALAVPLRSDVRA